MTPYRLLAILAKPPPFTVAFSSLPPSVSRSLSLSFISFKSMSTTTTNTTTTTTTPAFALPASTGVTANNNDDHQREANEAEASSSSIGRIWIHRPFHFMPSSTPCTTTTTQSTIISKEFIMPQKTPSLPSQDRLCNQAKNVITDTTTTNTTNPSSSLSSSSLQEFLNQICQSKLKFYQSQFQSRVLLHAKNNGNTTPHSNKNNNVGDDVVNVVNMNTMRIEKREICVSIPVSGAMGNSNNDMGAGAGVNENSCASSSTATDESESEGESGSRNAKTCLHKVGITIYHPKHTAITTPTTATNNDTINSDNKNTSLLPSLASPPRGICLHVHGGGWIFGDSQYQVAHRCLEMADKLNVVVVSVEYALLGRCCDRDDDSNPPNSDGDDDDDDGAKGKNAENPMKTKSIFDPVNDVIAAMEWVESQGRREFRVESDNGNGNLIASGESSGAHLLMLAMLHRRDRAMKMKKNSIVSPWKCLNLVYGVFDLSGTPSIHSDGEMSMPLCGDDLLWMYDLYCSNVGRKQASRRSICSGAAQEETQHHDQHSHPDRKDPSISPLYANLSQLSPALFTVGTADPLRDDTFFMATRYSSFGNQVELQICEGGEHGIGHFGLQEEEEMGKCARWYTLDFMGRHLEI